MGEDMGLRPKPHKLFEKSLTKNLMGKCQGQAPDTPVKGEKLGASPLKPRRGRYGALPQTPQIF